MSVVAAAQGTVSLTDSVTGSTTLTKVLNSVFTGDLSVFAQSQPIGTSPQGVVCPNNLAQFLYIKNLSDTATVIVSWTPSGGGSNVVLTLDPGAVIIFCESGTNGISVLSLQASAISTPVEYIIVG